MERSVRILPAVVLVAGACGLSWLASRPGDDATGVRPARVEAGEVSGHGQGADAGAAGEARAAGPFQPPLAFRVAGRGPIEFFNRACANCHGEYGSNYLDEDVVALSDAELAEQVEAMLVGIAKVELPEAEARAIAAYCATIPGISADSTPSGGPMVAWTGWASADGTRVESGPVPSAAAAWLIGEATPGSTVRVRVGDRAHEIEAKLEGHVFRADLSGVVGELTAATTIRIEARLEGKAAAVLVGGTPYGIPRAAAGGS